MIGKEMREVDKFTCDMAPWYHVTDADKSKSALG